MTKAKLNRFSQSIGKFFNIFTFCSRPSTTHSNSFLISTPIIPRSNIYLSPRRLNRTHLNLPFYPTKFTSLDQVCYICQEFWTFLPKKKKHIKLSAFISIRGQIFGILMCIFLSFSLVFRFYIYKTLYSLSAHMQQMSNIVL